MSGIYEEAVLREVIAEAYKTGGVHLNIGVARAIARAAIAAMPSWRPSGPPAAWRYQRKIGWEGIWRASTVLPTFEAADEWTVEPLYAPPPKPEGGQT